MPIIEYKCECGEKTEDLQYRIEIPKCKKCGEEMKRVYSIFNTDKSRVQG